MGTHSFQLSTGGSIYTGALSVYSAPMFSCLDLRIFMGTSSHSSHVLDRMLINDVAATNDELRSVDSCTSCRRDCCSSLAAY